MAKSASLLSPHRLGGLHRLMGSSLRELRPSSGFAKFPLEAELPEETSQSRRAVARHTTENHSVEIKLNLSVIKETESKPNEESVERFEFIFYFLYYGIELTFIRSEFSLA
ncbi:hypothetical protein RIU52_05170 [Riemerella anatipestifer]|nr:hypothetical protein [Riemerella anatipestifer]